jgi:hypothetical protein
MLIAPEPKAVFAVAFREKTIRKIARPRCLPPARQQIDLGSPLVILRLDET